MLYIDPSSCIDCGACVAVCPVNAITTDYVGAEAHPEFVQLNSLYFREASRRNYPLREATDPTPIQPLAPGSGTAAPDKLRVAIVGSGPSGSFAARELLFRSGLDVHIDMYERSTSPWGLVRYGVAPDHGETKLIVREFEELCSTENFRLYLNVEVGVHIPTSTLDLAYHAVIYATGGTDNKSLGIPGEDLPGIHSAYDFIRWYNGDPTASEFDFDLSGETAVVVGNGNAALDVARVLLTDVDRLARTDIADHALARLLTSNVRRVVILGRRGPVEASFTLPELLGLLSSPDFDVAVEGVEPGFFARLDRQVTPEAAEKARLLDELTVAKHDAGRCLTFRFNCSPTAILGESAVAGMSVALGRSGGDSSEPHTNGPGGIDCGVVFRATGSRGESVRGLPFEEQTGTIPHRAGRVMDSLGSLRTGAYVVGWIKRGPTGVIGTNKYCARETVASLVSDHRRGLLVAEQPGLARQALAELPMVIDRNAWRAIDTYERARGALEGRPRSKVVTKAEALSIAGAFACDVPTTFSRSGRSESNDES